MLQFDLIGSIDLRREDGEELDQLLRQPKRLALLAYLVTPSQGTWHRRDTLLGIFWPELDTAHARTALRNALYVLRQALGDGVVLTRGDEEVAIDPSRLATDLDAIWTVIREGKAAEALARYKGDLLPGLYPGDSPGFDSWLESLRTRLRSEVTRLAAREAERLEREHHVTDALRIAKRILEINADETSLRRVLRLYELLGDRASGLVIYERFAAWLHSELGAEPSAETRAIAERLREQSGAPPTTGNGSIAPLTFPDARALENQRRRIPLGIAIAAALLVVLLAGFIARVFVSSGADSIGNSYQVTSDEGLQIEAALSPNGQLVAYAMGDPGSLKIWIQNLERGTRYPLTTDSEPFELVPRWSPQNDQILYLSGKDAWVTSAQVGSEGHVIIPGIDADRSVHSASWSPRGDSVLYVLDTLLQVTPLNGMGSRLIGTGRQLHSCVWSPDGKWIACVTGNWVGFTRGFLFGNRGQSGILLFPAKGGDAIEFTDQEHTYESPAWSEDGRELWVLSNREGIAGEMYSIPVGSDGHPGAPARIGLEAQWISLAAHRVAYSNYDRSTNVWSLPIPPEKTAVPVPADDATQVTTGSRIIEIATVSPDGKWLVYDGNEKGSSDIYRVPLDNPKAVPERLTVDPAGEFVATVSPDGKDLLYHQWGKSARHVLIKRFTDGKIVQPWPSPLDHGSPRFSPDGNSIAAWMHETEGGQVIVLRRTSDTTWSPPKFRLGDAQLPYWTPDGKDLLYVTLSGKIMRMSADSGLAKPLYRPKPGTNDPLATNVIWLKNMTYMWFIGMTPNGRGGIWTLPATGGTPHQIIALSTARKTTYGPVFDSDGKRLYFVIDERNANVHWAEVVRR